MERKSGYHLEPIPIPRLPPCPWVPVLGEVVLQIVSQVHLLQPSRPKKTALVPLPEGEQQLHLPPPDATQGAEEADPPVLLPERKPAVVHPEVAVAFAPKE